MMNNNPYQKYKQNSVKTASQGELTLMLYNGCLKFLKQAKVAIDENNIENRNTNLIKAQNIIRELMVTLNMDYEISNNYMKLYDYLLNRLIEANTKNDRQAIEEVEGFVAQFQDNWKQVIQKNRQIKYG